SSVEAAVPAIVRMLWEDGPSRLKAIEVLGRLGAPAKPAIASLGQLLKVADIEARLQAALALWKIDHRAAESLPVLVAALKTTALPPQRGAASLPGRFGLPQSVPLVPPCQQAAEVLSKMG